MNKACLIAGGLSALGIYQALPPAEEWAGWLLNQALSLVGGILCSVVTARLQRRWENRKKNKRLWQK